MTLIRRPSAIHRKIRGAMEKKKAAVPMFLPVPSQNPKEYSDETARLIDEEVKRMLREAHAKVREILAAQSKPDRRACAIAVGERGRRAAVAAGDPESPQHRTDKRKEKTRGCVQA
jgi:hypothetical protein